MRITADYDEFDEICCIVGSTAYGAANQVLALMGGKVIPNDPYTKKAFYDFLEMIKRGRSPFQIFCGATSRRGVFEGGESFFSFFLSLFSLSFLIVINLLYGNMYQEMNACQQYYFNI